MSKNIGKNISRTLRQEFESGTKYPKGSDFDWLEPHFFALTRVILPGKKNSRLLIEMPPKQVTALIDQELAAQELVLANKHAKEKKRKNEKLKQLKAELQAMKDRFELIKEKSAGEERQIKKIRQELAKRNRENGSLRSENATINQALEEQELKAAAAKAKILEKDRRIGELEELLKRQQTAMIAHNVSSGEQEDQSFKTPSTVLDQSIVKVSSNKPLDGSYASKQ